MKRLVATLTACLLLAGCAAAPRSDAGAASPAASAPAQSTQSTGANPDLAGLELQVLPEMSAVTTEGFYTMALAPQSDDSLCILYGDFQSSSLIPLCAAPGCTHTGPECQSWLPACGGGARPMVIGEQLFLVFPGSPGSADEYGENALAKVMTLEPDGSGKTLLTRFGAAQQLSDPYITDGKDLYCTLQTVEDGWPKEELIRIELATGEWESIYQMDMEHDEQLTDAFGSCVLLSSLGQNMDDTIADGMVTTVFSRLDLSTGEKAQVFAPPSGDTQRAFRGRELYYYSQSENALHCLDCETLTDKVLKQPVVPEPFAPEDAEFRDCRDGHALFLLFPPNSDDFSLLQVDLATGESSDFTLTYSDIMGSERRVSILATLPGTDRYLVDLGEQAVDFPTETSDGIPTVMKTARPLYGVMDAADYWSSTPNYQTLNYSE